MRIGKLFLIYQVLANVFVFQKYLEKFFKMNDDHALSFMQICKPTKLTNALFSSFNRFFQTENKISFLFIMYV